ncbi:MAG: hypothetical protein JSW54_06805 [Fidelibacterota bacterium]|nr:MAG: hypothetical protein JSW54_06805 [Candidatus Neomarinimicrobiota bacterium]
MTHHYSSTWKQIGILAVGLLVAGLPGCHHLGTSSRLSKSKDDIQVHDIQSRWDDPTLFTMWVVYDPVAPPSRDRILAKVRYVCDRFCAEESYYGYVIEKTHDYDLEQGMQLEVRFFGFQRDYQRYMRARTD